MEYISGIAFTILASILALSFIYYFFSLLKLALFEPLINFIKVKIGLKNKDEINYDNLDNKVENIISEKHGKFLRGILDFFKGFQ